MDEGLKGRYKEFLRRLRDQVAAGATDVQLAGPDGARWRVRRDADGSLRIDRPGAEGVATRVWQPTAERPSDYPAEIPFLAETLACTGVAAGGSRMVMVQWWKVRDAARVFERLVTDTLDDGWVASGPRSETIDPPGVRCTFVRGGVERTISRLGVSDWDALMLLEVDLPPEAV